MTLLRINGEIFLIVNNQTVFIIFLAHIYSEEKIIYLGISCSTLSRKIFRISSMKANYFPVAPAFAWRAAL